MQRESECVRENKIGRGDLYVVTREDLGIDGNKSRMLRDLKTFCDVGGGNRCLVCECECRECKGFFPVAGGEITMGSEGVRGETEASESVDETLDGDSSGTLWGATVDVLRREWRRSV
jgi:hypothetical protein